MRRAFASAALCPGRQRNHDRASDQQDGITPPSLQSGYRDGDRDMPGRREWRQVPTPPLNELRVPPTRRESSRMSVRGISAFLLGPSVGCRHEAAAILQGPQDFTADFRWVWTFGGPVEGRGGGLQHLVEHTRGDPLRKANLLRELE